MLVEGDLASDGEASRYDDGSDDDEDDPTTPRRAVRRGADRGRGPGEVRRRRYVGTAPRGSSGPSSTGRAIDGRCASTSSRRRAPWSCARAPATSATGLDGVNSVPVLKLLVAAAAAPDAIARDVGAAAAPPPIARAADASRAAGRRGLVAARSDAWRRRSRPLPTPAAGGSSTPEASLARTPLVADAAAVAAARRSRDGAGGARCGVPPCCARRAGLLRFRGGARLRARPAVDGTRAVVLLGRRLRRGARRGRVRAPPRPDAVLDLRQVGPAAPGAGGGTTPRPSPRRPGSRPSTSLAALRTAPCSRCPTSARPPRTSRSGRRSRRSSSGVAAALPRLFAEAAAARRRAAAAPAPTCARRRAVVLDPAAAKTQEDHAAATVADALDGISEDFDEAENEAEEGARQLGEGRGLRTRGRPDPCGYRKWGCPNCGDYHCLRRGLLRPGPDRMRLRGGELVGTLPDPAAFVKDRLEEVDASCSRAAAPPPRPTTSARRCSSASRGASRPSRPRCPNIKPLWAAASRCAAAERTADDAGLRSPLSSAERAAVLRAFTELDGKTTQMRLRRSVERILGSPEGFLDAKKAAPSSAVCVELVATPRVPGGRRHFGARHRWDVAAFRSRRRRRRTPSPFKRRPRRGRRQPALDVDRRRDGARQGRAARPLLARLLPLRPTAPFAADAIAEAMAVSAGSRSTLVAAVNAAAAKLAARPATARTSRRRGRTSASFWRAAGSRRGRRWGACDLGALSETTPNGLDLVDFAMEVARHACAPPTRGRRRGGPPSRRSRTRYCVE